MSQCVFCEKIDDLNSTMTITIEDGTKVVVHICDLHSEDATVKLARIAYSERQGKIDLIIKQAKALGLNITGLRQEGNLIMPVMSQPTQVVSVVPVVVQPTQLETIDGDNVVSTMILDSRRGMNSVGGMTERGHVSSHSSHDLNSGQSRLSEEVRKGKAKMVTVEGRVGMSISIPETRIDGTGTTRMKITKKEDDTKLQTRFKRMGQQSIHNDVTPNFAREGYKNTQSECPICRGSCVVKNNVNGVIKEITCPKCDGVGIISTI